LLERLSTLPTQSNEFYTYYIKFVGKYGKLIRYGDGRGDEVYIGYQGDEVPVMVRMFREYIKQFYPEFVLNQFNEPAIDQLAKIAAGKSEKRGIVLHGPVGSGKTTLLLLWTEFRQQILTTIHPVKGKSISYWLLTPRDAIKQFLSEGFEYYDRSFGDILILDDIGVTTEGNYFGTKTNLLADIICSRYDRFKRVQWLELYATTNLLSNEMEKVIGPRAWSRLQEMTAWNEGAITSEDHRKGSPLKKWPSPEFYNHKYELSPITYNPKP